MSKFFIIFSILFIPNLTFSSVEFRVVERLDYDNLSKLILEPHCLSCHSSFHPRKGLDFSTYELSTDDVPFKVIQKGDPEKSKFYKVIKSGKMPPRGPKLTQEEIKFVYDWIKAGAPEN